MRVAAKRAGVVVLGLVLVGPIAAPASPAIGRMARPSARAAVVARRPAARAGSVGVARGRSVQTELFFGRDRPDGGTVTDAEWQQFVDEEIMPRFPAGFLVLAGNGQYRGHDGAIVREASTLLVIVRPPTRTASRRVDEIRRAYRRRFAQEAVLRIDDVVDVAD